MEDKIIEGTIKYKITVKKNEYEFEFSDRTAENEVLCLMVARESLKFMKENLKASKKQAKGTDLQMVKDRYNKVTGGEYMVGMSIEHILMEFLNPAPDTPEVADEKTKEILEEVETKLKKA